MSDWTKRAIPPWHLRGVMPNGDEVDREFDDFESAQAVAQMMERYSLAFRYPISADMLADVYGTEDQ